jgi:Domain of unknown function (DUF4149)
MTALRYLAILGLVVWVGGLAALGGVAAPAIFAVLGQQDPVHGRELAGLVFGDIFQRFQYVATGLAVVILASLGARAALGPRPRHFKVRLWSVVALLAVSLVTTFVITPRIVAIRDTVGVSIERLPDTDARRVTFGRLHGAANGLMLVTLVAGLGLLWIETIDAH